jgi:hypothetical protein
LVGHVQGSNFVLLTFTGAGRRMDHQHNETVSGQAWKLAVHLPIGAATLERLARH